MSEMLDLIDPFERLLAEHCAPRVIRDIERGGDWEPTWAAIADSGFLDGLVPEENGGFALGLVDIAPLIARIGASAVPLPIAETMVARALLSRSRLPFPTGPIVLATSSGPTPFGAIAHHAVSGTATEVVLLAADSADPAIVGTLDRRFPTDNSGLRGIAAVIRAQLIAGAADRILDLSVSYANDRQQFGKPIGRQQAVQQQLAILAEQAVSARICAAIGMRAGLMPVLRDVATAKIGAGIAAKRIASIAHAVHGAIGVSEEFDLQLLTRRLYAWRLADGSEQFWSRCLGERALADPHCSALTFALQQSHAGFGST
jgi:acyl-CoA dehydrogenase